MTNLFLLPVGLAAERLDYCILFSVFKRVVGGYALIY